ncbi:MAG: NRDE family protein [Cellvibrionaceae bacterium]|nr:NRDE family protein [Cellvibrionaceae bacterium]
MCLILFRFAPGTELPLVVAANRDEAYARPTAKASFWGREQQILAGRDLQAGGSWLGVDRRGRFAAVTNFREGQARPHSGPSRGELVAGFLEGEQSAQAYMAELATQAGNYAGFNLLIGDANELWYFCNSEPGSQPRSLSPGYYGLSNGQLDCPWPKVTLGKKRLQACIDSGCHREDLQLILLDDSEHPPEHLPDTGVGAALEKLLSPLYIRSESYGTRSSSLVMLEPTQLRFDEYIYPNGDLEAQQHQHFKINLAG